MDPNLQQLHSLEQSYNEYQQRSMTSDRRFISEVLNGGNNNNNNNNSNSNSNSNINNPANNNTAITAAIATASTDPLTVIIPFNSTPTEILAQRFASWRYIISALIQYLNEVISIQDEVIRQQIRLSHSVQFTDHDMNQFFTPQGSGSIQDIPQILINYHNGSASLAQRSSKELRTTVLRLEDLKRDLLVKIKEIKSLASDFKNSVGRELQQTRQELSHYLKSLDDAKFNPRSIQPKSDPYLTKIILDRQIKRQISQENFLFEAYTNLQSSGKELEKIVLQEVQSALITYAKLIGEQAQLVFDSLITNLDYGVISKPTTYEWEQFIQRDRNFIRDGVTKRDHKQMSYDKDKDPLALEIRSSFLERRSKFLKSYSKGFYVLTPTFFHEFKSADRKRDLVPVMSLSLDEIEIEEHSTSDSNQFKFVIKKIGKLSSHKFIFRCESYQEMMEWYNDLKSLKKLNNPVNRGLYAQKNHISRVSTLNSGNRISMDRTRDGRMDSLVSRGSALDDSVYVKRVSMDRQPPYPVQQPFVELNSQTAQSTQSVQAPNGQIQQNPTNGAIKSDASGIFAVGNGDVNSKNAILSTPNVKAVPQIQIDQVSVDESPKSLRNEKETHNDE